MTDRIKNIVVTSVFLIFIIGLFLINIFKAPTDVSTSERRKLAQFPELTLEKVNNTKFMKEFADYAVDQFVGRDFFRSIKANYLFNVLNQKDNNGIYIADGHASKTIPTIKENEVEQTIKNINKLYNTYLSKMNVYYSLIPDKNYFLAEKNGYPHMDYSKFEEIVSSNINKKIKYINIFDTLDVNDYYTTDIHWKQENLEEVTNRILSEMNLASKGNNSATNQSKYTEKGFSKYYEMNELYPFYGTYYGQSALPLDAEKLNYLTNDELQNVKVKMLDEDALAEGNIEFKEMSMYDVEAFTGIDPYNVYLSGPKMIITLENPDVAKRLGEEKELIIFRDSFGSSLAPLLTTEYSKITLVDLRYIASPLLRNVVDFKAGQDVLIIYSTEILNNGSILKIL